MDADRLVLNANREELQYGRRTSRLRRSGRTPLACSGQGSHHSRHVTVPALLSGHGLPLPLTLNRLKHHEFERSARAMDVVGRGPAIDISDSLRETVIS